MGILGSPIIPTFCFCPYFGLHGYPTIYIYIYVCHFSTGLIYMKDSWITVQPLLRYGSLIVICYHYYTVRYVSTSIRNNYVPALGFPFENCAGI